MKILFLCVQNSARSQMAEAMARVMAPAGVTVASAGSSPSSVNPFALRALAEVDVPTEGARSKSVDELPLDDVDVVITLCAEEVCPAVLAERAERLHWLIEDPAGHGGGDEEQLARFREARERIRDHLREYFVRMAEDAYA